MPDEFRYSGVSELLERSLGEEELEPDEAAELMGFINSEVNQLHAPSQDSYVVLGSYEDPYIARTSAVENELNKRRGSYAFLVADLPDLDIRDSLPGFRIKFHLLCENADYVVGVYEGDVGGEVGELGKISEMYLTKTHILARDEESGGDYSVPTREDLKVFELNSRCYWWSNEEELRSLVDKVP
jgi:hypothetical protein